MSVKKNKMHRYELALLLPPEVDEEGCQQTIKKLSDWIGKDGTVGQVENWGKRPLAYPILKHLQAVYLFLDIELAPDKVNKLNEKLRLSEQVLRHMFVRRGKVKEKTKKPDKKKSKAQVKAKKKKL